MTTIAFSRPVQGVGWACITFVVVALQAAGGTSQGPAVAGVEITVSDMAPLRSFFEDVLTFEPVSRVEVAGEEVERLYGVFGMHAVIETLRLGDEYVRLVDFLAPEGRSIPESSRSNDGWFQHIAIVVSDMDAAYARLREYNVQHVSTGPQTLPDWNPNAGGIRAFYFNDPDGHVLELIWFPEGKGDPRWHRETDRMFLGIDHTAIASSDTDESLRFYENALGFHIAGTSENYGTEQEHLNNVFGARVRITGLRLANGLGVELLEYLAPGPGREYPEDSSANDLWHWRTLVKLNDLDSTATQLQKYAADWISPGIQGRVDAATNAKRALTVRDPDRHAVMVLEND